jgi:hypothetical protein
MALIHFLLVYDLNLQRLVDQQEFRDGAVAAKAYADLEERYRGRDEWEIVLVGADSIETIMLTHGQYFAESASATPSAYLAGV